MRMLAGSVLMVIVAASSALAQTPAYDPSARLQEVLPAEIADRVLARIADARARELPAEALAHRALELAAKGARPADIARRIEAHANALERGKEALDRVRPEVPSDEEVRAAGEVIARGVDDEAVSALASAAPSGRSLVVPLHVLSELMSRGMPVDDAVARVRAEVLARASDAEMQADASNAGSWGASRGRPALTGRALGEMQRVRRGPPDGLPANPGKEGRTPEGAPSPPVVPTPPADSPGGPPPAL
jgi:hypothetical protein